MDYNRHKYYFHWDILIKIMFITLWGQDMINAFPYYLCVGNISDHRRIPPYTMGQQHRGWCTGQQHRVWCCLCYQSDKAIERIFEWPVTLDASVLLLRHTMINQCPCRFLLGTGIECQIYCPGSVGQYSIIYWVRISCLSCVSYFDYYTISTPLWGRYCVLSIKLSKLSNLIFAKVSR